MITKRIQERLISLYPFKRGSIPATDEDMILLKKLWYEYFENDVFAREARRAVVGYATGYAAQSSNYINLISKEQLKDVIELYNKHLYELEECCKLEVHNEKVNKSYGQSKLELYAVASMIADYVSDDNKPICKSSMPLLSKYQKDYLLEVFADNKDLAYDRSVNAITRFTSEFTDKAKDGFDVDFVAKLMNVFYFDTQYSTHSTREIQAMIDLCDDWIACYVPRILVASYTRALRNTLERAKGEI